MTTYSVSEVFKRLKVLKITSNEESVRRWLRTGKLVVYQIREEDLQRFIDERMPDFNKTIVVNNNATAEQSVNTTHIALKIGNS